MIGLAPTAVAAAELRDATGAQTDTLAALTYGLGVDALPEWAPLVGPGTLVLIDEAGMRIQVGGHDLDLSATEYRLLLHLVNERGHALSRGQLIDTVWADSPPHTARVVDTTIQRLRMKLSAAGLTTPVLETLRGIGYRLR